MALRADGSVALASPTKETPRRSAVATYVLEEAIVTDFALVHAANGDRHGNLVFDESARNFNPLCAMAGRITIAEVEELVEPGELDPDAVHLPGHLRRSASSRSAPTVEKRIERRTVAAAATGDR